MLAGFWEVDRRVTLAASRKLRESRKVVIIYLGSQRRKLLQKLPIVNYESKLILEIDLFPLP